MQKKSPVIEPGFSFFIDSLFRRISSIIDIYGEEEFIIPYHITCNKRWKKKNA